MENYILAVFGYTFVAMITLLFVYLSLILVFKILGKLRYWKEEIVTEYAKIKAHSIHEKNEKDKIFTQIMLEEKQNEVNS